MNQHLHEAQTEALPISALFAPAASQNDALENDAAFAALSEPGQKTVTDYLSQMGRGLPASEQTGTRRELQNHLLTLIAAYQEIGDSEGDAIKNALAQFGAAKKVRRGLQKVALRGAFRDRAFWQAAIIVTAAQIVLNLAGKVMLGYEGEVRANALVQFYSDRRVDVAFTLVWLFHLLLVGFITSRLAPRYAPLAAMLFSIYQALGWLAMLAKADFLLQLTPLQLAAFFATFVLLLSGPPVLYALTAHLFVRRRARR